MAEEKVTPMMVQYRAIKEQNKDKVLFFRLGDFYEMFEEDAVEVSRLLNLTLTQRAGRPMCGIPFHAAKSYIRRLLDLGKKIAICEQMELSKDSRQIAKREVIQVVTPATVVDDDFLDARTNSYVFSLILMGKVYSVSYADITSGDFCMTTVNKDRGYASLLALLGQVKPREILVNEDDFFTDDEFAERINSLDAMVTKLPSWSFSQKGSYQKLTSHMGTTNLHAFGFEKDDPSLCSGGALLGYLEESAKAALSQITTYRKVDNARYLLVDEASRHNLELITNNQDGSEKCTLFSSIDKTITSGGARMLKQWLSFPLRSKEEILSRQEWVTYYIGHQEEAKEVREILKRVLDLERLSSRVSMHRSMPQDLVGIQRTVECFFQLMERVRYHLLLTKDFTEESLGQLLNVIREIARGINEQTQGPFVPGEVIKPGYDNELDKLQQIQGGGKKLLNEYLERIKGETGITTMKLSYNKIIGHYIEVTKGQVDKVPSSFYRKQTLVNGERYTTDELVKLETQILKSGFAAEAREKEVYESILQETAKLVPLLLEIGRFLSKLDVLTSLCKCALENHYQKPEFVEGNMLSIEEGRHSVVESQLSAGKFIPNDLLIREDKGRFCLITGPNMAGKSTYLRQNALIVLLAQIGSYVPAKKVVMSPVDRLFCRVGASDNLARGESTFLVEMQEAALILRSATPSSFVIIDELGRGTSSQDGMAIAYAVMKELEEMKAKTLFATHYHELAEIAGPNVQKLTLKVSEEKGNVIFLRKVIPGIAESSYGLNVAKLAGVPSKVIREAQSFQKKHDDTYLMNQAQPSLFSPPQPDTEQRRELAILDALKDMMDGFDLNHSTPLEALTLVGEMKKLLGRGA